jgi:hypothetical protein
VVFFAGSSCPEGWTFVGTIQMGAITLNGCAVVRG